MKRQSVLSNCKILKSQKAFPRVDRGIPNETTANVNEQPVGSKTSGTVVQQEQESI